jgi:hypothetical protein
MLNETCLCTFAVNEFALFIVEKIDKREKVGIGIEREQFAHDFFRACNDRQPLVNDGEPI